MKGKKGKGAMGLDLVKNILHYFVFFSHFSTFCTIISFNLICSQQVEDNGYLGWKTEFPKN